MRSGFSKFIVTASMTALLLLTSVPPTARLVPEQLDILIGRLPPALNGSQDDANSSISKREAETAMVHPGDFDLQFAEALRIGKQGQTAALERSAVHAVGPDGIRDEHVRALLTLRPQFDDHVELAAGILRYLTSDDLLLDRPEEDVVESASAVRYTSELRLQNAQRRGVGVTEQALDAAFVAAIRGEILDPQNAFFPTMLAFQDLVQHHDTEAVQELDKAAKLPDWDDYASSESRTASKLYLVSNDGGDDGFSHLANSESALFPDLMQIRSMARVVTALAVQKKLAGDREGGFRLRQSLARVGATIRARSKSAVGCLMGPAVTTLSASRPGGAPIIDPDSAMSSTARQAAAEASYISYLARIGHPEAGTWYVAECAAAERMRLVETTAEDRTNFGMFPVLILNIWWMLDVYLLESAIAIALVGLLAAFWVRSRRITAGRKLHRGVHCGLALVLMTPIGLYISSLYADGTGYEAPALEAAFAECLILVAVMFMLKRQRTWREATTGGLVAVGTLAGLFVALCIAGCLGVGLSTTACLSTAINSGNESGGSAPFLVNGIFGSLTLILPLIIAGAHMICSRRDRLPASVAVARGLSGSAPTTVACLLVAYGLACIGTCIQDANLRRDVDQRVADEGKYSAAMTGSEWPEPVPYPAATPGCRARIDGLSVL